MRNICLTIEYDGTAYHGWQRQENALSIQEVVEEALAKLTRERIRVIAAGRTDTGVHARGQVINFNVKKDLSIHQFEEGMNSYLPADIVVKSAVEVPVDFHSRFSARKRTYHYYILPERTAVFRNLCWQYFQKFDVGKLFALPEIVIGKHDFSAFSKVQTDVKHKFCEVFDSVWVQEKPFLVFQITANRFLHGMVRTLVGTMMEIARGYFQFEDFSRIMESRDRGLAGAAAPAQGLFLEKVIYEEF